MILGTCHSGLVNSKPHSQVLCFYMPNSVLSGMFELFSVLIIEGLLFDCFLLDVDLVFPTYFEISDVQLF